jgi:hypothetical protein
VGGSRIGEKLCFFWLLLSIVARDTNGEVADGQDRFAGGCCRRLEIYNVSTGDEGDEEKSNGGGTEEKCR